MRDSRVGIKGVELPPALIVQAAQWGLSHPGSHLFLLSSRLLSLEEIFLQAWTLACLAQRQMHAVTLHPGNSKHRGPGMG